MMVARKSLLNTESELEVVEDKSNVLPFKPLTGGSEPPKGDSDWWLRNLPEHYVFIAAPKGQIPCITFQVIKHFDKSTMLFNLEQQKPDHVYTSRFSQQFEWLQTLPVVMPTEEEQNASDPTGPGMDESPASAEEQHRPLPESSGPGAYP